MPNPAPAMRTLLTDPESRDQAGTRGSAVAGTQTPKPTRPRKANPTLGVATTRYTLVPSPIDEILLVGSDSHLTGLYMAPHDWAPIESGGWVRDDSHFAETAAQLRAYFAGELDEFSIPLAPRGTPFQERVWQALLTIPYGRTASYGEIAAQIGQPTACRAVGLANGRNPISIIIPCHRVIGASGALTGYGGGLPRKTWLLDMERRAWG